MHVLQIVDSLGMGGAETWLMEVLKLWHEAQGDHPKVDFLATGGVSGVFDDEARALGATIHYVPYRRRNLQSFTRSFRALLKTGTYDAIHDHADYPSGWHYLLGGKFLPPVRVTHVHNPAYQIRNNYGVTFSRRVAAWTGKLLVAHYATHIAGTSRQILSEYGFDEPRFRHIPKGALHCGFEPARFLGDPARAKNAVCQEFGWQNEARILLFAGRVDQSPCFGHPQNHKNSRFGVDVGILCAQRDPRIHMVFAGAPSSAVPLLEARIAEAGLSGRMVFVGIRRDIERLMLASDTLLFPSRAEGLGMVAVEAQAAGLPVIASTAVPRECVVVPELVTFLPVEGDPKPWADVIQTSLATNRPEATRANALVRGSAFSIRNSAAALERLYSGQKQALGMAPPGF